MAAAAAHSVQAIATRCQVAQRPQNDGFDCHAAIEARLAAESRGVRAAGIGVTIGPWKTKGLSPSVTG
jgi:hypothetical protein